MTDHHALVAALVADIPTGTVWPEAPRERWLIAAAAVFNLVYGAGETIDMRTMLARATATDAVSSKQLLPVEPVSPPLEHRVTVTCEAEPGREDKIIETFAPPAPARNVGGAPKTTGPARPAGIPTNLNMALDAIDHHEGNASAPQILAYVRRQYWAGAPSNWTASLYEHVTTKKLARDGINFVRPIAPKIEEKPIASIAVAPAESRPVSAPENRLPANGVAFEHGGKKIFLHKTEFRVAEALRRAMGKGHLGYDYLCRAGLASDRRPSNNDKGWCHDIFSVLSPKLETIGLLVIHSPNFGYSMQEAAAA